MIVRRVAFGKLWPVPIDFRKLKDFWPLFWEGRWLFVTGLTIYVNVQLELPLFGYPSSLAEVRKYRMAMN